MNILTVEDAGKAVGQAFMLVLANGQELTLSLDSAAASKRPPLFPGARQPFRLLFSGTPGQRCPQGTYTLRNDTLGELQIFLVPVAQRAGTDNAPDTFVYEAVFS